MLLILERANGFMVSWPQMSMMNDTKAVSKTTVTVVREPVYRIDRGEGDGR